MAKLFKTSEDIVQMAEDKFEETSLPQIGINLKVISMTKANEVLKVSKASATTEFLTKSSDMVTLFVYEDAFDRLTDEQKYKLMEGALSNISFDSEKDKLNVDNSRYGEFIRMRRKYEDYGDIIEESIMVIEQLADEEKRAKEEERAAKKAKKNG
jgi:hypothetical protein